MSKVYFTSDLHFGHKRLAENCRRMSIEESDKLIINNWNNIIRKRDIVYVLGDFVMEEPKLIYQYFPLLEGNIRIIGGNHDDRKCCKIYSEIGIEVLGCLEYKGFICTHIPIHESQIDFFKGNIHGHIHTTEKTNFEINQLGPKYFNVNVEFNDFKPVHIDYILNYFSL